MMEKVSLYAVIISVASICAGLMNIISPDGAMKKVFKYILSLFLVCAVVIPVKGFCLSDFSFFSDTELSEISTEISSEIDDITKDRLDESVSELVKKELNESGISNSQIKIIMDIESDNCIYITKAEVYVSRAYASCVQDAKRRIKENIGIDADIYLTGE